MDTGMATDTGMAITAVTGTITVGGEGTAITTTIIIIDRDLTLKRPPRLAASILSRPARDIRLVARNRYGGPIGNVRSRVERTSW
jgi:hypothetical protein